MTDSQVPYTVSVNSSISDLQHYNGSTAPWLRGTGSIMWNSLRVVIYDDITEVNCIVHENRSVGVLWPRYLQLVWQRGIEAEPLLQMSARYWRRASLTECLQGIDAATLTSYNMSKVPKQCLSYSMPASTEAGTWARHLTRYPTNTTSLINTNETQHSLYIHLIICTGNIQRITAHSVHGEHTWLAYNSLLYSFIQAILSRTTFNADLEPLWRF